MKKTVIVILTLLSVTVQQATARTVADVQKLEDQVVLAEIAKNDERIDMRTTAVFKLNNQALLTEIAKSDDHVQVRSAAVLKLDDQALLTEFARSDKNETIRQIAMSRLNDQKLFAEIARSDENHWVRHAAVRQLNDQTVIEEIARTDKNQQVFALAMSRLNDQTILIEIARNNADWLRRYMAIGNIKDQAVLEEVARNDSSASVRQQAAYKLNDQNVFVFLAKNDSHPSVRLLAIDKLNDQDVLADIAKNDKDARVRKEVEEKLRILNWDKLFPAEQAIALRDSKVLVKIGYPPKSGTHSDERRYVHSENFDNYSPHDPRPPIFVPIGCNKLLSRGCKVTSSDPNPIIGELSYITDGEKTQDAGSYVELSSGLQWIQIDLGKAEEIHAICIWHYPGDSMHSAINERFYRDVIVQISNDAEFKEGVVTVFNNDHDNSAGLGKGEDKEYAVSRFGRPFEVDAIKGRYVRCYSHGNSRNGMNHYIEVEIFGRPIEQKQKAEADNAEVRRKKAEQQ